MYAASAARPEHARLRELYEHPGLAMLGKSRQLCCDLADGHSKLLSDADSIEVAERDIWHRAAKAAAVLALVVFGH